jgi:tRNA G18 (ribose-2'-O)-methylase SpoU
MGRKIIIAENIRSLHNVGAIFRTADGAGWGEVFLCGYTGCPPDRRIEKVSLGAENTIAWKHFETAGEAIAELRKEDFQIVALEISDKSTNIFSFPETNQNIALILGNEVEGVTPEVLALCDTHVEIPMRGHKESLNVSVAAGIALYVLGEKIY